MRRGRFIASLTILAAALCGASCQEKGLDVDENTDGRYTLRQGRSAKRGVAFAFALAEYDMPVIGPSISWSYDWSSKAPEAKNDAQFTQFGVEWVPMAWNGYYDSESIRAYKASHPEAKYLLAFNEPNLTDQANVTPKQAAALWPDLKALAEELGLAIISPAMNYGTLAGYHNPVQWLDEFFACDGVSLDDVEGIALHCYMPTVSALSDYLDMFSKYGKPLWLTEFCNGPDNAGCSEATQKTYLCEALNLLEGRTDVARYAWFQPRGSFSSRWNNALLSARTPVTLTDLGKIFVNFPTFDKDIVYAPGEVIPAEQYCYSEGGVHFEASTDGGVLDISELLKGAFVEYQLDVPKAGDYYIQLRYRTYGKTDIGFSTGGDVTHKTIASTSDQWTTAKLVVPLPKGRTTLRITAESNATIALNWLRFF